MTGLFAVVVTWFTTFLFVLVPAALSGFAIGKLPVSTVGATALLATLAFAGPYLWMADHIGAPLSDRDHSLYMIGSTAIFAALLIGLHLARNIAHRT